MLLLARTLAKQGVAVVAILHDLGLAFTYADDVVALHGGRAVALGAPREVLTPGLLRQVFQVDGLVVSGHLVVQGPLAA